MPHAHGTEAHIKIAKANPKKTHPRPKHVAAIQTGDTAISLVTRWRARELIAKSANQMPKRMTTKGIAAEQNNIDCENDRSEADSK
jgi:hypothetical protein